MFTIAAKVILTFFISAALTTFVVLNCFAKKKKPIDPMSMKLNLAASKQAKNPNPYTSKTTNKVSGLGPDDPDLDSSRLRINDEQLKTARSARVRLSDTAARRSDRATPPVPKPAGAEEEDADDASTVEEMEEEEQYCNGGEVCT